MRVGLLLILFGAYVAGSAVLGDRILRWVIRRAGIDADTWGTFRRATWRFSLRTRRWATRVCVALGALAAAFGVALIVADRA